MDEALRRVPALEETGIRKFYNGPESFTPDNQFVMGEAPGLRRLLRRAPGSTPSASRRPAVPGGRWPSGSSRASRPSDLVAVDIRRFARVQRQQPVAARPGRRGARPALRRAVAEPRDGDGPAVPLLARARPAGRRGRVVRLEDGLGAAELLRAGRASRPSSTTRGASRPGCRGRRPSTGPPARRSRSSTRRRSPSTSSTARARSRRSSGCARPTSTPRLGRATYTPLLNRRGAYESDLTVTRTGEQEFLLVSSSATTVRDIDWIRRHVPDGLRRARARRDHGVRRPRRDGAALARPAAAAHRRRPGRGGVPVRDQPDDPARRRHRARHPDDVRR